MAKQSLFEFTMNGSEKFLFVAAQRPVACSILLFNFSKKTLSSSLGQQLKQF